MRAYQGKQQQLTSKQRQQQPKITSENSLRRWCMLSSSLEMSSEKTRLLLSTLLSSPAVHSLLSSPPLPHTLSQTQSIPPLHHHINQTKTKPNNNTNKKSNQSLKIKLYFLFLRFIKLSLVWKMMSLCTVQ